MAAPKIAVIFYSTYGTNYQIAQAAADAAKEAGAEVRLLRVRETAPEEVVNGQDAWKEAAEKMAHLPIVTPEDMVWADGYFISAPTRFGQSASQLRAFIDTLGGVWSEGKLAGKAITATTSAQNPHGGQEATTLGLYTTAMHWGAIIVPPGYTDDVIYASGGNPYGYSAKAGEFDDAGKASVTHQAKLLVDVAKKLIA
ncbi:NAD(P)H:quinone oxidoreductase type IV [Salipiger bermudensis]|uniref:NAD(P)H:quinone oxidoreductase type IV n=1 Tax=Salipiger bermudensis TaxID=344736 RepID=UPI001CD7726D|nr:NAD(P)H:quinone oxidoreductase type IV [Salipiger bermudensis]MCA0963133.1 NAD(P)H:quinone oxidoreductase type IV [Salipiger bermudensis]